MGTKTKEKRPPTVGLVIKRWNKKRKKKNDKKKRKNPRGEMKKIVLAANKNLKTRCADQSHLALFISTFLLKSNAGRFLLSFFSHFSSFLVCSEAREARGIPWEEGVRRTAVVLLEKILKNPSRTLMAGILDLETHTKPSSFRNT